jgi:hypothetical protein
MWHTEFKNQCPSSTGIQMFKELKTTLVQLYIAGQESSKKLRIFCFSHVDVGFKLESKKIQKIPNEKKQVRKTVRT